MLFFQQKTSERNGSKVIVDSNEFAVYEESGNPEIVNNANLNWLLFKANFIALHNWQDFISETSVEEIKILSIVLIKFTSLLKTHFSFAVEVVWSPAIWASSLSLLALPLLPLSSPGASPSSSPSSPPPSAPWHLVLRTNMEAVLPKINAFSASPSCLELAAPIGGWRIIARSLKTFSNKISFSFIKQFKELSLLCTLFVDVIVLMGGKFQKFSS